MRRPLAAALAAMTLAACATAPVAPPAPPPPAFAAPSAERLARLDPFDRTAAEVEGELVRLAVVPQAVFAAPAGRGRGAGPAPGPAIVVLREEAGAFVYAYVGPADGWRSGLIARTPGLLAALQAARDASSVRRAVPTRIGSAEISCTLDKVPLGPGASPGWRYTLALTPREPGGVPGPAGAAGRGMREQMELLAASKRGAAAPGPFMILDLQPPEPGRDATLLRPRGDKPLRYAGAVVTVGEVRLAADGGLASATFPPWRPPPELFLAGRTAKDVFMAHDMAGEQAINDTVVEWKTRQLPGWLQKASGAQLEEAIVQTEKGLLALDLAVRSVKDQVDAAARKNETAFADAGAIEQLLEQRKMLLGVVLQAMKGAAAQKAR